MLTKRIGRPRKNQDGTLRTRKQWYNDLSEDEKETLAYKSNRIARAKRNEAIGDLIRLSTGGGRPTGTKAESRFNLETYNYLKNKYPWMNLEKPSV
jgi:hypothetical protein